MTFAAPAIVPIVEGPGDVKAAPILLRRILHEQLGRYDLEVKRPKNAQNKDGLIKGLGKFLVYASRTPSCAAILVLLDTEKDCPRELGVQLARKARAAAIDIPIAVVCAKREYENWFLASDEAFTEEAEEFSGAKVWLSHNMPQGLRYKETINQARLSASMDLEAAFEASRSFRRLCKAVEELVGCIDNHRTVVTPMG